MFFYVLTADFSPVVTCGLHKSLKIITHYFKLIVSFDRIHELYPSPLIFYVSYVVVYVFFTVYQITNDCMFILNTFFLLLN